MAILPFPVLDSMKKNLESCANIRQPFKTTKNSPLKSQLMKTLRIFGMIMEITTVFALQPEYDLRENKLRFKWLRKKNK